MDCPKCNDYMVETNTNGIYIEFCRNCDGAWLSSKKLQILLNAEKDAPSIKDIRASLRIVKSKKAACVALSVETKISIRYSYRMLSWIFAQTVKGFISTRERLSC